LDQFLFLDWRDRPALKQKKESSKMSLLLISGPAMEPVSLAEAKAHLRIDGSTEDTLVASLITSARVHIETTLSQSLITQQWALWLDEWPDGGEVKLPLTPVQEVVSITIYDSADTGEIVAPDNYISDKTRIVRRSKTTWPRPLRRANGIEIVFRTGYGDNRTDIPHTIRQATLLLIAHWYEHREPVSMGADTPQSLTALLTPYKSIRL
jgi:uncharacterized phiE125 gp8 family phage protein